MTTQERDETGQVKGKPGALNVVGATEGYLNEPPRLIVALHDSPRGTPDHTVYEKDGAMVHKAEEIDSKALGEILDWVRKGLGQDLSKLWEKQDAQTKMWAAEPEGPDETWAKRFSERYFFITYGGPGQAYFGDGIWDAFIFSRVQFQTRKLKCVEYYAQKGKEFVKVRKGDKQVGTWDEPDVKAEPLEPGTKAPSPFEAFEPNSDPAISIVGACQQTTTYGAVSRGFFVEDHLSNAGYAASESSGGLSMFTAKGIVVPESLPDAILKKDSPAEAFGTFYTLGSKLANGATIARTSSGGMTWEGAKKKGDKVGSNAYVDKESEAPAEEKKAEAKKEAAPDVEEQPVYVTTEALREVAVSTDTSVMNPPIGPGTIITYNPHGFIQRVEGLHLYSYELEDWGAQMKVRAELCREQRGNPNVKTKYHNASRPPPNIPLPADPPKKRDGKDVPEEEWDRLKRENEERWARWTHEGTPPHRVSLDLPKSVQDPGSHIAFVLRVSKDEEPSAKRIQMFDTGNQVSYWILEAQGQRGVSVRPVAAGIFDGCSIPSQTDPGWAKIPCNSTITGIGVVPKIDPAVQAQAIAALEKARPVGLCRLVLTLRTAPDPKQVEKIEKQRKAQVKKSGGVDLGVDLDPGHLIWGAGPRKDDVLYVSRLLRMYGDDASQNFYLSRLLWSLRNTPYFTNIQPWWFVFYPKGVLAKSMWAKGGREMTIQKFVDKVLPKYRDPDFDPKHAKQSLGNPFKNCLSLKHVSHYQLSHVMTNCGSEVPERAGRSYFYCRMRSSLSDGGSTTLNPEGWKPPSEIWKVVEATPALSELIHPKLQGSVVPDGDAEGGGPSWDWFRKG